MLDRTASLGDTSDAELSSTVVPFLTTVVQAFLTTENHTHTYRGVHKASTSPSDVIHSTRLTH